MRTCTVRTNGPRVIFTVIKITIIRCYCKQRQHVLVCPPLDKNHQYITAHGEAKTLNHACDGPNSACFDRLYIMVYVTVQ